MISKLFLFDYRAAVFIFSCIIFFSTCQKENSSLSEEQRAIWLLYYLNYYSGDSISIAKNVSRVGREKVVELDLIPFIVNPEIADSVTIFGYHILKDDKLINIYLDFNMVFFFKKENKIEINYGDDTKIHFYGNVLTEYDEIKFISEIKERKDVKYSETFNELRIIREKELNAKSE